MLKCYSALLLVLIGWSNHAFGQVIRIDSVLNVDHEITLVYTISDSLEGFRYHVDAFAVAGKDTLILDKAKGYPSDSLEAGTYRMRWDAVNALGRFRGQMSFFMTAKPGFRLLAGPEPDYKPGQNVRLRWYGGDAINDEIRIELLQNGEVLDTLDLQFGILSYQYPLPETIRPGEGYYFRLSGQSTGISWTTSPFIISRVKDRKWLVYAIPAGVLAGVGLYLLLTGPIDPPEPLPDTN